MKGIGRTLKDLRVVSYFSKGKRWLILCLCMFLALVIWLLQSLNDTYTKTIEIEIAPVSLPSRYSIDDSVDLPSTIKIEITATGSKLMNFTLSHQLFNKEPKLHLEVDSLRLDPEGGFWSVADIELVRQVRHSYPELDKFFSSSEDRIFVRPDYIGFGYVPMDKISLPIVFNNQFDFGESKNRFLKSLQMDEEEVVVYGLKTKLDSIKATSGVILTDTSTIMLDQIGISTQKVALLHPEGIKLSLDSVNVHLDVQELRYYTFTSNELLVKSLPEDMSIRLFPASIKVTYLAEEDSNLDEIKRQLKLYIDLNEIKDLTETKKLKVNFDTLPREVHMIQLEPDQVEFILEEKAQNR